MDGASWAAVGALATAVIGGLAAAAVQVLKARSEVAKGARQDTLDEYKDLLDRSREDVSDREEEIDGLRKEVERLWGENSECKRKYERVLAHNEYLEETLAGAKIPFRPWVKPT